MSTTVDERIVAAKFDAKDFEKGVDKTIKKLDELKKSLDLKDATKSVKELAEKTEVSTDSMSKSLDKLTDRITTFTGMIKQKLLSGLADEVANVFLRMEQSIKNFVKSISTDQLSHGLDKYQQVLTSVRVMMSNGVSEEDAYKSLDDLRDYVDQTSYSLTQMTDALSKMVSSGLKPTDDALELATKATQGIANACASAGINATDAQRAFYNLAQAYGKGKLEYTDYKSLELLNMTTATFKENLIQAAVEAETLKKVSDGVWKITEKAGEKTGKGKKVTMQNVTEMLRYDFVTNDVMNKLFGDIYYFSEKELNKIYDELGIKKSERDKDGNREKAIQKAKQQYGELAVEAYLAAREARSFTDVVNTLKDAVSTGWSKSFEYLFGELSQANKFFTSLTEGALANTIYMIRDWRNAVLESWNMLDAKGTNSGGEAFRQSILNITNAIGTLIQALGIIDVEDEEGQKRAEETGRQLFRITVQIRNFTTEIRLAAERFSEWMNDTVDGVPRVERLRRVFINLSSVFVIIGRTVAVAFRAFEKIFYALGPVLDGIVTFLMEVTQPLVSLKENDKVFDDLTASAENLSEAIRPIAEVLGDVLGFLGQVGAFVATFAIDTFTSNIEFLSDVLGIFMEIFTGNSAQKKMNEGKGILDGIVEDFNGIKDACTQGIGALRAFFGALIGDIRTLLGLTDTDGSDPNAKSGVFANLINFFDTNEFVQKAKAWVNQAIVDVGDFIKSIPDRVKKFGESIYDTIWHLFFYEKREDAGGEMQTKIYKTQLGEWLDGVIKGIKDFIVSIPQKIIEGVGTVGHWIDDMFNALFGYEASEEASPKGASETAKADEKITSEFEKFIADITKSIREWFNDLPNKIQEGLKNIGNFFEKLIDTIDQFLFGKKTTKRVKEVDKNGKTQFKYITSRYKTGFSKWLDQTIQEIKKFIEKIPEYIKAGIKGAGDVITTIVNALFGTPDNTKEVDSKDVEKRLAKPFEGINLTHILDIIKDIGKTLLNQIARIFTGSEDIEKNQEWFSNTVANGIEWVRTKAETALKWVLDFLANLPTTIAGIFSDDNGGSNKSASPVKTAIINFGTAVGNFFLYDLPTKILEFVDKAVIELGNIWDKIYKAITGGADASEEAASKEIDKVTYPNAMKGDPRFKAKSKWETFTEQLGKTISDTFANLPKWIAEGINAALIGMNDLLGKVTNWLKGENIANEMNKAANKAKKKVAKGTNTIYEAIEEGTKDTSKKAKEDEEDNPLFNAIIGIGQSLYNLITTTVPKFISEAWTWLGAQASLIWSGLSEIFSGKPDEKESSDIVTNIVDAIKNTLTVWLPEKIKGIWDLSVDVYSGIAAFFTGGPTVNDRQEAIKQVVSNIQEILETAFKTIGELFKSNDPYAVDMGNLSDPEKAYVSRYVDTLKKANERAKQKTEKSGFWTFVDSVKTSLLSAFESLGPSILNGLSSALDWIGKIATFIMDALTGKSSIADQVEAAYGKEKPELRQALTNIGESMKRFFLKTIPALIGSAIGALAKDAPKWFASLFGAMNAAAEEESKDEFEGGGASKSFDNAVNNATSVMNIVKTIFSDLKSWIGENTEFLEIMGVIVVLTMLFSKLSDLFGISDELGAAVSGIKWTAIALAVVAITGIMNSITEIVNSGDPQKISDMETIIDKIGNMFLALGAVMSMLALSKWGDAFGNKWEGGVATKVGLGEKLLGGLTDAVTGLFGAIGLGAGAYVGTTMAGAGVNNMLASISDGFTTLSAGIDDALSIIAPFIDKLVSMNTKLDTATGAAEKIKNLFGVFFNTMGELYKEIYGYTMSEETKDSANGLAKYVLTDSNGKLVKYGPYKEIVSLSVFMQELSQRMNLFIQMSTFIDQIASAVNKLDGITDLQDKIGSMSAVLNSGDFGQFMTGLLNLLNTAITESDLDPQKLGTTTYLMERNSGMALALDMLASSLSIFADGISGFDESSVKALNDSLDVFRSLYEVLGDVKVEDNSLFKAFLGDNSLSKVGEEIRLFGLSMKQFYGYLKEIEGFETSESSESINRKITSVSNLARSFGQIIDDLSTSQGFAVELIGDMGEKLPAFAENVGQFFANLDRAMGNITPERAETLYTATNTMSAMMSSIRDLSAVLEFSGGHGSLSDILDRVFGGMSDDVNSNKLAALIRVFDKSISLVMKSDEFGEGYKDIGEGIAQKLFEGIQSAFDTDPDLRPTITPVLKLDEVKQQLIDFFGTGTIEGFNLQAIAREAMKLGNNNEETTTNYTDKFDEVTAAINTLKDSQVSVNDLGSAFSQMKIITDTGELIAVLTPGIDEAIGRRIWLIQNNIVP